MEVKKFAIIGFVLVLVILVALIGYQIIFGFTCMDDAGPKQYFYKKDLVDANINYEIFMESREHDINFTTIREEEQKVRKFLESRNPLAVSDSYCGTNQYYKILSDGELKNVSAQEQVNYLIEKNAQEEVYSITIAFGTPLIQKFQLKQ